MARMTTEERVAKKVRKDELDVIARKLDQENWRAVADTEDSLLYRAANAIVGAYEARAAFSARVLMDGVADVVRWTAESGIRVEHEGELWAHAVGFDGSAGYRMDELEVRIRHVRDYIARKLLRQDYAEISTSQFSNAAEATKGKSASRFVEVLDEYLTAFELRREAQAAILARPGMYQMAPMSDREKAYALKQLLSLRGS